MTTSASARRRRPRTVIRSGSPGPPPTRETPGVRVRAVAREPSRSPSTTASRTAAERRGSLPLRTATVTPSTRPVAGVQAVAASASSARTHQTRRRSASAEATSLAARSRVAISAYQAPSRSPSW